MQGFPGVKALRAPTGAHKLRADGKAPEPTKARPLFNLHQAARKAHATAHPHTVFQHAFRSALRQYGHPGVATALALQAMQQTPMNPDQPQAVQPIDSQG